MNPSDRRRQAVAVKVRISRAREAARRTSCANNLKQLGLIHKMFAGENKGNWVPRAVPYMRAYDANLGCWSSFDGVFLYPEYLADHTVTLCPSDAEYAEWLDPSKIIYPVHDTWKTAPDPNPVRGKTEFPLLSDRSYVYWGYLVNPNDVVDPRDMGEFGRTLDNISSACVGNTTWFGDITVTKPSTGETVTLYCFREGVERLLITDINSAAASNHAASETPVMWDNGTHGQRNAGFQRVQSPARRQHPVYGRACGVCTVSPTAGKRLLDAHRSRRHRRSAELPLSAAGSSQPKFVTSTLKCLNSAAFVFFVVGLHARSARFWPLYLTTDPRIPRFTRRAIPAKARGNTNPPGEAMYRGSHTG